MRQRQEVSLCPSATHDYSYLFQCFSDIRPIGTTSGLYTMRFRWRSVFGNRIYRHSSPIRCKSSPVLHLEGEAYSDHPADFLAFLVIVYLVVRSNVKKAPIPSLLKKIARDATSYFLFIFTSHLVLVMFLLFADVRISSQCSTIALRLA